MGRNTMILVSDNPEVAERAKTFGQTLGLSVQVYRTADWENGLNDPSFRQSLGASSVNLASGHSPLESGAKILQFPQGGAQGAGEPVVTIDQLESQAIENAIDQFNGNLTEAAKALGIGRATLYRKVKQYNLDPSAARKKRAA